MRGERRGAGEESGGTRINSTANIGQAEMHAETQKNAEIHAEIETHKSRADLLEAELKLFMPPVVLAAGQTLSFCCTPLVHRSRPFNGDGEGASAK